MGKITAKKSCKIILPILSRMRISGKAIVMVESAKRSSTSSLKLSDHEYGIIPTNIIEKHKQIFF